MGGNALSSLTLLGMSGVVLLQHQGCTGTSGIGDTAANTAGESPLVADILAAIGPQVVTPALERFLVDMTRLEENIETVSVLLESEQDIEEGLAEAQQAWLAAMGVWEEIELMQIGPAGSSLTVTGGQDLRDEIYSWPTANTCRVDQETVLEAWGETDFFASNLVNAYGMDALERLLFGSLDCACPSAVNPVADGSWDALGDSGVLQNRMYFASIVSQEVRRQVEVLADLWSIEGGDYGSMLLAEDEDAPYASRTEALNAVFDALFYLEKNTKDRKLAQPLGLVDCETDTCLEDVEAAESGASLAFISANLVGFQTLFAGGEGVGLDDLLEELGHGDLAEEISLGVQLAMEAVEEIQGPLDTAIVDENEAVLTLHASLSEITSLMKTDLATVLNLEVPAEAAGDND